MVELRMETAAKRERTQMVCLRQLQEIGELGLRVKRTIGPARSDVRQNSNRREEECCWVYPKSARRAPFAISQT